MIVSLNWIKKFTGISLSINELSSLIGARLVEVDKIVDINKKYSDVLVVRVVECCALEGSDHLNILQIDDGQKIKDVDRNSSGFIQVVCGAPNIAAGQMVAWLPPKTTVPQTFDTAEPFVLDSRKLRGVMSHGMIASASELDLYEDHSGILVLSESLPVGESFAKAFELDDYLLHIENKSLTHRPDCFGVIGFAREIALILGNGFVSPEWLTQPIVGSKQSGELKISAKIDDKNLSARYTAIAMSGVDMTKKSPDIIQSYLARVGVRPINAVVDVTNYLMLETGQPLHAFDYDKLLAVGGGKTDMHVRSAADGEKLELLDGKIIKMSADDIVIAVGDKPIALAGAMGGISTAIDDNTKNIVIESATFNLYKLRSTQMRHGIFSEAITRFTKGQPAELCLPVLCQAIELIKNWAGADVSSKLEDVYEIKQKKINIDLSADFINQVLGSDIELLQIATTLSNAEFDVNIKSPDSLSIDVPFWRSDIHITEDIIEEIGRINGFDNIQPTLPKRSFSAVEISDFDSLKSTISKILCAAGANEVMGYSFIHGDIIKNALQKVDNSYKVMNSISPDLQYYRQSLMPSLLDVVNQNIRNGYDEFSLFEINKTHSRSLGLNDEKVPLESYNLALVYANKNTISGAPYYQAKQYLSFLMAKLGINIGFEPMDKTNDIPFSSVFENRRSAQVIDISSKKVFGYVGEYKKSVTKVFKLSLNSAGFEIDLLELSEILPRLNISYIPTSKYPSVERDVCFKVDEDTSYGQIIDVLEKSLMISGLVYDLTAVDIYQSDGSESKNITIRVKLNALDHTLTGDEVSVIINKLTELVVEKLDATVI